MLSVNFSFIIKNWDLDLVYDVNEWDIIISVSHRHWFYVEQDTEETGSMCSYYLTHNFS